MDTERKSCSTVRSEGDAYRVWCPGFFVFARFVVFEQQPVALGDEQRVEAAHAAVILELAQALLDIRAEVRRCDSAALATDATSIPPCHP